MTAGLLGRLGLFDAALAGAGEEAVGGIEGGLSDLGAGDARVAVPEDVPAVEEPTGGGCSFAASTLVATPSGARPIGSLKVGDPVIAYNPAKGHSEAEPIQHVWLNHDHDLVDVGLHETVSSTSMTPATSAVTASPTASTRLHRWLPPSLTRTAMGIAATVAVAVTVVTATPTHAATITIPPPATHTETIHTTATHPWLTADRGWVAAGALQPGEHVVTLSGGTETVAWVHVVPGQAAMYNLTVAHDHTYAVGNGQYVVHNTGPGLVCGSTGGGPGQWEQANESMSERAAQYQEQITGVPRGYVYRVNGVKFDGFQNGTLLDAKGPGYATFFKNGLPKVWWQQGADALVDEAGRQIGAAPGWAIQWHVAEPEAALGISSLLQQNGYTAIQVINTPMIP